MKFKKYFLLPLVALTLVGCGTETSDDPDTGTTTEPDTGTTTEPDTGTTTDPDTGTTTEPDTGTTDPDTGTTDPDTGGDSEQTPEPVITKSLEITSQPDTTTYKVSQSVSYTGLEVQKVDKSDDEVTNSDVVALTDLSFSLEEGTTFTDEHVNESLEVTVSLLNDPDNEYGSASFYLTVQALETITVTFKNGQETLYEDSFTEGGTATYEGETPTQAAGDDYIYTFLGWYVQGDGTFTLVDLETTPFYENTTLLAYFKSIATSQTIDGITYEYNSGQSGFIATAYDETSGYTEIDVPDDIEGVPVVQINSSANNGPFRGKSMITSVKLGANVKTLASRAFQGMTYENLTIDLNEGLTTMTSGYTFYQNTGIKEITIPSTVETLGSTNNNNMFNGATNLETVTWNTAHVTTVGGNMFNNTALKTFNLAEGVSITSIGTYAFNNSALEREPFDMSNVTSIGTYAFANCTSLTSFSLPTNEEFTSLSNGAFNSSGLQSITIPSNVTSLGTGVFGGCTSLETVTIQNSDLSLTSTTSANTPFYGCTGLTTIFFNGTLEESKALIEAEDENGVNQFFGETEVTVMVNGLNDGWQWSYSYSPSVDE